MVRAVAMLQRLGFDRHESRVLVWGAITLFLTGWADVSLKNVSEAYFVNSVGPERLPLVFLASSALLVGTTWALGILMARSQRLRLLPRLLGVLAVAILPLWWLILNHEGGTDREIKSAYGLLLIASKQVQALALLSFWAAINDLVNARQAKRVFAPLMAGWTLGTILGSFASDPLAGWLGVPALVPVSSAMLILAGVATYPLRRGLPTRLHVGTRRRLLDLVRPKEERSVFGAGATGSPEAGSAEAPASVRALWRESALFRLLFVTVLLSGMLGPMLYFQFQWVADAATPEGDEGLEGLLHLYSLFRGWVNVAILVAQLTVTSTLYRRFGIPLSVLISPLTYLAGFFGLSRSFALPMGIGAMSLTKLQDNAVFDPASRVLYNLFPDRHRARAGSFLDGPVKRGAGALGNLVVIVALEAASVAYVGVAGIGLALIWLLAAVVLWQTYPRLLLAAASNRRTSGGEWEEGMLDPSTVRALNPHLLDPDPGRCALAIGLLEEARPELAIPALVHAYGGAHGATRPLLLTALEDALDKTVTTPVRDAAAAAELDRILAETPDLPALDRSRLVQCYGRVRPEDDRSPLLTHALHHEVASVRLAAAGALDHDDLDDRLREAAASSDLAERTIARRELRAALLCDAEDPAWEQRLAMLVAMLDDPEERRPAAEALADVARRHGERVVPITEAVLERRHETDVATRRALLRFAGHAGCVEHAGWLVDHLASDDESEADAAREGLVAMGAGITDILLKEASHGRRSKRDAILPLLRDLHVDQDELWELYERELAGIRKLIVQHHVMRATPGLELLEQRLDERIDEGLHTALLLLAGLRDRDEYESLAESLPGTPSGRRRATLVEVLEEIATAREKTELLPLLDEDLDKRCARAAGALGILVPSDEEVLQQTMKSSDELTRVLVAGCLRTLGMGPVPGAAPGAVPLAPSADLEETADVLSPTEIALQLKGLPMFDGLTTRQLMDLAQVVSEVTHAPDATVVSEGGMNESMFLIVDGKVEVRKQGRRVAELGPGEFFGEMSVLERARPSADVITTETARLLCLQRADLFRLMEEFPTIPIIMCQTLSRRMRELLETRSEPA